MSLSLLEPVTSDAPHTTVKHWKAAPAFLKSQTSWSLPYPLSLLFESESQASWQSYENVMLACLRAGDFDTAYQCLTAMIKRFGKENERVMALSGLYQEAAAKDNYELEGVLADYDDILKEDPTLFSVRKRRAALLRTLGKTSEAVGALITILDASPTDAEAWAELADIYFLQGLYEQSIHCWEEVLLVAPNAWNIHARLAEVLLVAANGAAPADQIIGYAASLRRYCRSIELCDDYLRGYYGLKLASDKLLPLLSQRKPGSHTNTGDSPLPTLENVKRLNALATSKLAEIVRKSTTQDKDNDGYREGEIAAARQLLERSAQKLDR